MRSRKRGSRSRRSPVVSAILFALALGCGRSQGRKNEKATMSVQVTCSYAADKVRYAIKNTGAQPVHLLDGARMPYLLRAKDGALLVLHGVNAPEPGEDYHMVEI